MIINYAGYILQIATEKTFEDINIELSRMHAVGMEDDTEQHHEKENDEMEIETNIEYQSFSTDEGDIIDSGAMEHSSDSDYEPRISTSDLIKPNTFMEIPINDQGTFMNPFLYLNMFVVTHF